MATIICLAGFGDNASMFAPLLSTQAARHHRLVLMDLPGFGAPPLEGKVTLSALAQVVDARARSVGASVLLAHSVASVIATKTAQVANSPIETILSLEGNLTAEDAYFSGTAADYGSASAFRVSFLARLETMTEGRPEIARYRDAVAAADTRSLWELGRDARAYSDTYVPGNELVGACSAAYFYNPENLPAVSLRWLSQSTLPKFELPGATHWPSVDQSETLSRQLLRALA